MKVQWMDGVSGTEKAVPVWIARLLNEPIKEFSCGLRPLHGNERSAAIAEFKNVLRSLVDQWIDSGRVNQAVTGDNPSERSIVWHSTLYPTAIFETLVKFWERNFPRVIVDLNGSWTLAVEPKPKSLQTQDALHAAREYAIFEFARLLDSPSPERLFRCDSCGVYFVRARAPRKDTPIYHGTFCAKCKHRGGVKRVEDSRKQHTAEKISWAADAWAKWTPSHRHGKRSEWVAKQVKAKLPASQNPIKANWVTRHQTEIEMEVERRNNAKG
jgi:hypothetical protein